MKKLAALALLISSFMATQLCAQAAHSPAESGKPANKPEKTATKKEEKSGTDNFLGPANAVNPNEPTTTAIYSDEALFDTNKSMAYFGVEGRHPVRQLTLQAANFPLSITNAKSK